MGEPAQRVSPGARVAARRSQAGFGMSIALDAAVTAVSANSGAQACGVRAGDRIVSVNSAPAHTKQAIVSALTRLVPTPHPLPELRQLNCVFIIRYSIPPRLT